MLRVAAAVIFTVLGGVIGVMKCDDLYRKRRICESIGRLIDRISFMIGCRGDDVYAVCRQLRSDEELAPLTFIGWLPGEFRSGEDFHKCWAEAVSAQRELDRDEAELLLRIGEILGKTDASGQLSSLKMLRSELSSLSERRSADLLRKGRLYRSAGLLMGAMVGILVI